ncbi:MAG: hypothetical protein ACXW2E_00285 [Nitrososphaeraceae archaeon]
MEIKAIHNGILFQFIDHVNTKGQFEEQTSKGGILIIGDFDKSAKQPRWGRVISAGPQCSAIIKQPGCEVLIENLKWTPGAKYNNNMIWKTDEDQVLAYRFQEE